MSDGYPSVERLDTAIGCSWLTASRRGPFARLVRRETLQTLRFAAVPLLPTEQKSSRHGAIHYEFVT